MIQTSPASRLLDIVEKAQSTQFGGTSAEGWVRVFNITERHPHRRVREVVRLVSLVQDQLELVRAELEASGKDMRRFLGAINSVNAMLSVDNLSQNWASTQSTVTGPTVPVLATIAEFLPKTSSGLSDEDLAFIRKEIEDWKKRLDESDLPASVLVFLRSQIELIDRAVREYPIRGPAAFQEASMDAAVEWAAHEEDVEPYRARPEVVGVKNLWPKIVKIGKGVLLLHSVLHALSSDVRNAAHLVHSMRELTGAPTLPALPPGEPPPMVDFDPDAPLDPNA